MKVSFYFKACRLKQYCTFLGSDCTSTSHKLTSVQTRAGSYEKNMSIPQASQMPLQQSLLHGVMQTFDFVCKFYCVLHILQQSKWKLADRLEKNEGRFRIRLALEKALHQSSV